MSELISLSDYPVKPVLKILLSDKTTKQNIVFATDSYVNLGSIYSPESQISIASLAKMELQPRALKGKQDQVDRTKAKAEVMTPSWVVNKMNNYCDEDWFGRKNVFNKEKGESWIVNNKPIKFSKGKTWQDYVDSMRLEITCGEAPYLVSRYDTTTGDLIVPVEKRIGVLDRKLRIVSENADTKEEWMKWVIRAYESTYGFEYQGDNLLIGRINLLITFVDYMVAKWNEQPTETELKKIANIVAWNLWQMDGFNGTVPYSSQEVSHKQMTFFDFIDGGEAAESIKEAIPAKIFDWRSNESVEYNSLKEKE